MEFSQLKLDHIKINDDYSIKYVTSSKDLKTLIIKTPLLYLPFGVDKQYNNYKLSLQFKKTNNNTDIDLFLNFIQDLELYLQKETHMTVKSQLRLTKDYPPLLSTKVIKHYNKIITRVYKGANKENINIFSLKKGDSLRADLIIDKMWEYEGELIYKLKLHTIYLESV